MQQINKVKIKTGTRQTLADTFNVSVTSISLALNGVTNSELAKKIRKAAVELGGDPIYSNNQ